MSGKRTVMRIQLDGGAKRGLDTICDQRGMTQIAVMSRLVNWFVKQDEIVQCGVMGILSTDNQAVLARVLLQRWDEQMIGIENTREK